jgi:hypothetical protein
MSSSRLSLYPLLVGAAGLALLTRQPVRAADEIQVYNAEIAAVGQWTFEQHLNYTWIGRTRPDFPGGLVPNHSLNGTPEPAYGLNEWWEIGFYAPFAVDQNGHFLSNGAKFRTLFVSPHAAEREFFYGVNFEFSYTTPKFSPTRFGLEVRPIVGVRKADWEFIVNPIVDVRNQADFAPAARLADKFPQDVVLGFEYYGDFGQIGNFLPLDQQMHSVFAVTDFKVGEFDIDLGIGYGLTRGSDRLITKLIVGYAFPVPGKADTAGGSSPKLLPALRPVAYGCRATGCLAELLNAAQTAEASGPTQ